MKNLKKIIPIMLATSLLFSLGISASAVKKYIPKKTSSNEVDLEKIKLQNNYDWIEGYSKIITQLPDMNSKIKSEKKIIFSLINRILYNKIFKNYLESLGVAPDLDIEKISTFEFLENENPELSKGIYVNFNAFKNDLEKQTKLKKEIKNFVEIKLPEKIKNLKIDENDVLKALEDVGLFISSEYLSKKDSIKTDENKLKESENSFYVKKGKNFINQNSKTKLPLKHKTKERFSKFVGKALFEEEKEDLKRTEKLMKNYIAFVSGKYDEDDLEKLFKNYEKLNNNKNNSNEINVNRFFSYMFNTLNKYKGTIITNIKNYLNEVNCSKINDFKEFNNFKNSKNKIDVLFNKFSNLKNKK